MFFLNLFAGAEFCVLPQHVEYLYSGTAPDLLVKILSSESRGCSPALRVTIGNITFSTAIEASQLSDVNARLSRSQRRLALTASTRQLLERLACCVEEGTPVLLVGETGCGKTAAVQYVAELLARPLHVLNMSHQTDELDLLGGYKPLDARLLVQPLRAAFEQLFVRSFSRSQNARFLEHIHRVFLERKWPLLFKLMQHVLEQALAKLDAAPNASQADSEHQTTRPSHTEWQQFGSQLTRIREQIERSSSRNARLAFQFVEGSTRADLS